MRERPIWRRYLRFLGSDPAADVEDELNFHLSMRVKELMDRGLAESEARAQAQREFGDLDRVRGEMNEIGRERLRRERRSAWWESVGRDVRFACRGLRKNPSFTSVVVMTLALGMGATTAVFSVVNAAVLRPLPFPDPDRFVHLAWQWGGGGPVALSGREIEYLHAHNRVFAGVAAYQDFSSLIDKDGSTGSVQGLRVSSDFQRVVGIPLMLGRGIQAADANPDAPNVALISHGLWMGRFAGDPEILGREIQLRGTPYTIVGVLRPDFQFPEAPEYTDVLIPLNLAAIAEVDGHNYPAIARLKPGVSSAAAEADLELLSASFRTDYPDLVQSERDGFHLTSYAEFYVGGLRSLLWILLGATTLVLLIASSNVASLLLARAARRHREVAVRAALGATRARIMRELLTESLVLALAGALLGLFIGQLVLHTLLAMAPSALPRASEIGLDPRVLGFTFLVTLATGLIFGLAAALPSTGTGPGRFLRIGSGASGNRRLRSRNLIVVTESALAMVLAVGAGLLIVTLFQLRRVDPGFEPDGLLLVKFAGSPAGFDSTERVWSFSRDALEHLRALPEVTGVATASSLPLDRGLNVPIAVEGRPESSEGAVEWRGISPGYFDALGTSVMRGRAFTSRDAAASPKVAVVNHSFAEFYFSGEDPLGQRIEMGKFGDAWIPALAGVVEIVGIVEDSREVGLAEEPRRTIFVPQAQAPDALSAMPFFIIRAPEGAQRAAPIRRTIEDLGAGLPPPEILTMRAQIGDSLARQRYSAWLFTTFAGLALLLTAVGIYGIVAFSVADRAPEMGISMALGARGGEVVRLLTSQGIVPLLLGLGLGIVAALGLTRFLRAMLWGVGATDPVTFLSVALLLAIVGAVAAYLPARRASRLDPVTALRLE